MTLALNRQAAICPVEQRIRRLLRRHSSLHLPDLVTKVQADPETVCEALDHLCRRKIVKRLRPVGIESSEYDYYRLQRPADTTYLWELECHLGSCRQRPGYAG